MHEGNFRFSCKHCEKGVQYQLELERHMRVHHPVELEVENAEFLDANPAKCIRCPKRFPDEVQLSRHIKHVHRLESGIL